MNFPVSFFLRFTETVFPRSASSALAFVCTLFIQRMQCMNETSIMTISVAASCTFVTIYNASSQPSTSSSSNNNNTMWHETHVCRRMSSNFGNHIVRWIDTIKYAYTNLRGDENIFASVRTRNRMRLYVRACDMRRPCALITDRYGMQWAKQRNPPEIVNKKK